MFHFITLFAVAPEAEDEFVRRLGMGGAWLEQARCAAPALVAADLLRHQSKSLFLSHDIWTTPESYSLARGSEAVQKLLSARKQMAVASFEIGAFAFPALKETTGSSNSCFTQGETLTPADWLPTQQLEDELFDAALEDTMSNPKSAAAALAQIDAYFGQDGDVGETQHRQSLLRLLGLLRPNLAELFGEPSSLG
jgi:hypothetical protein